MIVFEAEIDSMIVDEEKISEVIYSTIDAISNLEEDGKIFKITIEEVDIETTEAQNRTLH